MALMLGLASMTAGSVPSVANEWKGMHFDSEGLKIGQADSSRVGLNLVKDGMASEPERESRSVAAPFLLSALEQGVRVRFPDVTPLRSAELAGAISQSTGDQRRVTSRSDTLDVVLFDVREKSEFAVSHLAGATRVDPELAGNEFLELYGDRLRGKRAVFYCSVGVRSAKLIERVKSHSSLPPKTDLRNLEGGIFRWHNEERALVDPAGRPVDTVHQFDPYWGRLISRQHLVVGG